MPSAALPQTDFAHFYKHEELQELIAAYAAACPQLVERIVIGHSHEGREILLLAVTNQATGRHADKPALWVDGNIHAAELLASTAVLYYLHQLLAGHGSDAAITQLLDTRTLYLVPRLNPDGAELALAARPRHIRSSTRRYPYDELPVEGLTPEDIDGDGRILSMRVADPHGGWKPHPTEPRLLIPREPGEFGGSYYRLMPEGLIQNYDGLQIQVNRDPEGLDLNRNFPEAWRPESQQLGAGPYPVSEPEVRACVDFVSRHPNIGAAISYHTHSGVILRPSGLRSDDDLPAEDVWQLKRFGELGTQHTGYPAISVWHEFKYHPKQHISGTQSWFYEQLGAMHWVVELWSPNREAGISGYKWIDWYRDHPAEDDLKLLAWSDSLGPDTAFVNWRPFQHPQLGAVEIGGWDLMNFWRNPPPALREKEVEGFPAWMTQMALSLPKLELLQARATALGRESAGPPQGLAAPSGGRAADQADRGGEAITWRVRMAVANAGYLGSTITEQARQLEVVRGVVFEIHLPPGDPHVELISGAPRELGPQLAGHGVKTSQHHFLQGKEPTADRAVVEWLLRAPRGTRIPLSARHERAGLVRTELVLD